MVLGEFTTPTQTNFPENISWLRHERQKTTQIACDRKNQNNQSAKPAIRNSEKRLSRGKDHYRPFPSKQVHKVPIIQNVDHDSSSFATAEIFLDSSSRLEGRVLAHKHNPSEKILSRIPLQGSKLALQGYALRSQHRPQNIHKTDCSHSQCNGIKRHLVPTISGRFTDHQFYKRGVHGACRNSSHDSEIIRLDTERKEVPIRTSTGIRLARSKIRSHQPHGTSHKRKDRSITKSNNISSKFKILLKKNNNEDSRISKLDRPVRSSDSSTDVKNENLIKTLQKTTDRRKTSTINRSKIESCQVGLITNNSSTSRKNDSNIHNSNRRLIKRLGISDKPKILPGRLRSHSKIFNQHIRITDSLVRPFKNNGTTCSDTNTVRQFNSSSSSQTLYIHSIPPSDDIGNHLETGNKFALESLNIPHPRTFQCSGRSIVQKHDPVNRMVIASQRFSKTHSQGEQKDPSRSICNQFKSSVENIHFSMSRPQGNGSRYNDSQLGKVGTPLSVPSDQYDFEGFTKTFTYKFPNSLIYNTRDSNSTMVYGSTTTEHTFENDTSSPSTSSVRQIGESGKAFQTSRLEIIKAAYSKQFPNCSAAVNLMAAPLRENSIKDYQHKWKIFLSFLKNNKIPFEDVKIGSVLQFFTFLFYEKHFKPGTVAHYRTALTVPLQAYFNIDLKVPAVADLLRAMWIQRPNMPNSAPSWSLNKVLSLLENTEDQTEVMLFRKTAFLLLLATGWRVSELHACVRNKEFCRFSENSTLYIRPHPSFLAKNENSQKRWVHKEIKVLKLENGSISKLCPVTSLKEYFKITSNQTTGELFITPGNSNKKLTIHQLSMHICSLILLADPATKAKVHDVRKYAASCALAETMLVGDLVSAINWSSPAIFYKFYLTQTEPLTRPVSLPVLKD